MKKIIFVFSIALIAMEAKAQDSTAIESPAKKEVTVVQPIEILKTKKGLVILPEAKDWRLTGSANALLDYTGNLFNKNNISASTPFASQSISISYFKTATKAYFATLGTSITNETKTNYVSDDLNTTAEYKEVIDKRKNNRTYVSLSLGIEKRKGQRRLQGIYGVSIWTSIDNLSYKYTYGNSYSPTNTAPTSSLAGSFNISDTLSTRKIKENYGLALGFGANIKIGLEYFFAPKMSIGAAISFGPSFSFRGNGTTQTENFSTTTNSIETRKTGGTNSFSILTNSSGLSLNFYL